MPVFFFLSLRPPRTSTFFPYTTLFRSERHLPVSELKLLAPGATCGPPARGSDFAADDRPCSVARDRKSTRLNSSHMSISYAVFCLKKKKGFSCPCHVGH